MEAPCEFSAAIDPNNGHSHSDPKSAKLLNPFKGGLTFREFREFREF